MKREIRLTPLSIALIYLMMSIVWIIATDVVLIQFAPELEEYRLWQTIKGLLFIGLTALVIYLLVKSHSTRIQRGESRLKVAESVAGLGHWVRSLDSNRLSLSDHLYELLDIRKSVSDIEKEIGNKIHPDDLEELSLASREAIENGTSFSITVRVLLNDSSDEVYRFLKIRGETIRNDKGKVVELYGTALDVTNQVVKEKQLEQSLEEKTILIQEIHHRVKNNLAIISGLLQLQIFNSEDKKLHAILEDSLMRIYSIALVHERLYKSVDFANISNQDYLTDLVNRVEETFRDSDTEIVIEQHIDDIKININQAVPCAMLVNELILNAYRHAFADRAKGLISIEMVQEGNTVHLKVSDDGVGLPEGFSLNRTSSLGTKLMQLLTRQLHGEIEYSSDPGKGTTFHVSFEKSDRGGSSSTLIE